MRVDKNPFHADMPARMTIQNISMGTKPTGDRTPRMHSILAEPAVTHFGGQVDVTGQARDLRDC